MALSVREWNGIHDLESPFRLVEFHSYVVRVQSDKVVFLGVTLERVDEGWLLETPFAVGQTEIEWWDGDCHHVEQICIDPDPTKIDDRHQWEEMLSDIAHWNTNLMGTTGVRFGSIVFGDGYNVLCVEAIHCLIQRFCERIDGINSWLSRLELSEPVNIQRIQPIDLQQYQSDISFQQWIVQQGTKPLYVNIPNSESQNAEYELIQVRNWIHKVKDVLKHTISELTSVKGNSWRESRVHALMAYYSRLNEALRRPPLYTETTDVSDTGSVVTSPNADFKQTHQLFQQITSPNFSMQSGQFPVSGRYSFGVYEIWCFQQIIDVCTNFCRAKPTLLGKDPLKWGGVIEWNHDAEILKLYYNPRFIAFWERQENSKYPYSLVGEQRPDFILEYKGTWLILDAKYRTTRVNVLDAFSSAFSYLSTLKIPRLQNDPVGCLLLVPKKLSESRHWFYREFHKENAFGLVCCGPKAVGELEDCIGDFLQGS